MISIDILNQRITGTPELTSDVEFKRSCGWKKRMQTLMSLSGDQVTDQLAQQDVTAAATAPAVSIGRDNTTGETVWTIEQDQLDQHLDGDNKTQSASEAASDVQQVQPENPAMNDLFEEVQAEQSEQPELLKGS